MSNILKKFSLIFKIIKRFNSDEVLKSQTVRTVPNTIFDKIVQKKIPVDIIYEDEKCLAFNDVMPQAPVHFLIIPKHRLDKLENSTEKDTDTLGHIMNMAGKLGKEKAPKGFRIVINNGIHGAQSVYYLHVHVLGGRQLNWPPG